MQVRHVVGLVMLVAAVPLQMYLMKYNENFKQLVSEIVENLNLPECLHGLFVKFTEYVNTAKGYLQSVNEYFVSSKSNEDSDLHEEERKVPEHLIRNFRPPHLKFRIGDIVLLRNMIIGVIVGWDIDMKDLTKEPEYYLLTENVEHFVKETQNNMIEMESIQIKHKQINKYFESFDGLRYIPSKWLKQFYPKD